MRAFHRFPLLRFSLLLLAAVLAAPIAGARVTKIEVTTRESPAYAGASFGSAGPYERIIGTLTGELDPGDRRNVVIQDLALAPKNANGRVEYTTTFLLVKPVDMSKSSGILLHQVPNRGGRIDIGGQAAGHVGLSSGWQGDLKTAQPEKATVPVARNTDGSSITGRMVVTFADLAGGSSNTLLSDNTATIYGGLGNPTPYAPASFDTSRATLTSYTALSGNGELSGEATVASADWAFADCRTAAFPGTQDGTKICLRNGFDRSRLYRLVYEVKDPLVLGVGIAAFRDAATFFRYAAQDDSGTPNPVAGGIRWAIGQGTSQSGNFLKTLTHLGFNEDDMVAGRRALDAIIPFIAARQNPINYRFAISGGETKIYEQGSEPALWWEEYADVGRNRAPVGMLTRCRQTGTCPKVTEINGSAEYWNLRMSLGIIGSNADTDIPLPDNVRRYYVPSSTHGGGNGAFTLTPPATSSTVGSCELPANPMPLNDIREALTADTIEWVTKGTEMPPSLYPRLADGTLVPATKAAMGFPTIPGKPSPDGMINSVFDYDFGPQFIYPDMSGVMTTVPPVIRRVVPTYVPKVDADGNEIVGVMPLLARLPLGTYLGWNVTATGWYKGKACAFAGGFIPFAKTRAERIASGDPRPSLEERYGTVYAYYYFAVIYLNDLVAQRYLLPEAAYRQVTQLLNQLPVAGGPLAPGQHGFDAFAQ
jgi:hypothetical protein